LAATVTDSFCQDCGKTVEKSWTYCRACGSPQPGQTANHVEASNQPKSKPSRVDSSQFFPDRTLGEIAVGVAWRWSLVIALVIGFGYALFVPARYEATIAGKYYSVNCGSVMAQKIEGVAPTTARKSISEVCAEQRMFTALDGAMLAVLYFLISFAVFYFINRRRVPRSDWLWWPYKRL
jgi:hypothetical protein